LMAIFESRVKARALAALEKPIVLASTNSARIPADFRITVTFINISASTGEAPAHIGGDVQTVRLQTP